MKTERVNADQNKDRNRKKRTLAITVAILLLLLLSGGTYAWFHMIDALNEFEGEEKSVVLHDDYDKDHVDQDRYYDTRPLEYNKDVYVENTGVEPLFIRIRLDEFMDLDGTIYPSGADQEDSTTWKPHKYDKDGTTAVDHGKCNDVFHDYWEWAMGGSLAEYTPATEGQKNSMVDRYENETDNLVKGDGGNKATTTPGGLKTMKEYSSMLPAEQAAYVGWILDEDGWAYWSQKLPGGTATSLLLNSVTIKASKEEELAQLNYYYGINVVMEALDETDINAWITGAAIKEEENAGTYNYTGTAAGTAEKASNEAIKFLKSISDNYLYVTDAMKTDYPTILSGLTTEDGYLSGADLNKYKNAVVDKLVVTTEPRTAYTKGEEFDSSGLIITATYLSGREEIISGYTIDLENQALDVTDTEVTITYQKATVKIPITVSASTPAPAPVLESIEVTTDADKAYDSYEDGDYFDPTGMEVTAHYDTAPDKVLQDTDYTLTPDITTPLTTTDTEIVISYTEDGVTKTTSVAITVDPVSP